MLFRLLVLACPWAGYNKEHAERLECAKSHPPPLLAACVRSSSTTEHAEHGSSLVLGAASTAQVWLSAACTRFVK